MKLDDINKTIEELEQGTGIDLSSYDLKTVVMLDEEEYERLVIQPTEDFKNSIKNLPEPL